MRYYKQLKNGEVKLLKNVTTPAQARKHGSAFPSVTTILKLIPNDYVEDVWKPQKLIEFARAFPNLSVEQIKDKLWGERECPDSGATIGSSSFGTNAHARIEDHLKAWIDGGEIERNHPYDGVVAPALRFLERNQFVPVAVEHKIACPNRRTAGTIDLVARHDGKIVLGDWKFRDCSNGKGKFYENKDLPQLAVEAEMLMEQWGLDYFPEIYSFCIDSTTGALHHKQWAHKMRAKGLQYFKAALNFYYDCPGLGYEANAKVRRERSELS